MSDDVNPQAGDISFLKNPQAWADFAEYSNSTTPSDHQIRLSVKVNPSSTFLELDLSRRALDEIPAEVYNFSRVEVLKMGNNKIKAVANAIGHLHRLKIFDGHKNKLTSLPDTILNCHYLTEINLNHNQLCSLPNNFRALSNLKVLSIAHNCFESLPHDVAHLDSLKSLNLQGNKLWHLPFNIQNLRHLTSLNIADNLFEHVPIPVCNIKNLEVLNIRGNKLVNVPTDFENLKLLTELNLANNYFEMVPYTIGDMRSLQFLNMSSNQLTFLPPRLTRMPKLRTLHAQHNQIGTIPNCFDNLEYLNIAHNKLRNFSVAKMRRLKSLNASHNDLENLPMGLCNLVHLEQARLNNNQIRFLSQDIVLLRNLRTLDLSYNKLSSLPQVIDELDKLEYFCIKGNKIESRPQVTNNHAAYTGDMMSHRQTNGVNKRKSFFNWTFKTKNIPERTRKPLDTKARGQKTVKRDGDQRYPKQKVMDYLDGAKPTRTSPKQVKKRETKRGDTDNEAKLRTRMTPTPPPETIVKRSITSEDSSATVTSTKDTAVFDKSQIDESGQVHMSVPDTHITTSTDYALIGLCNQVEALLNRDLLQPIISHKVNSKRSSIPTVPSVSQDASQPKESTQVTNHTPNHVTGHSSIPHTSHTPSDTSIHLTSPASSPSNSHAPVNTPSQLTSHTPKSSTRYIPDPSPSQHTASTTNPLTNHSHASHAIPSHLVRPVGSQPPAYPSSHAPLQQQSANQENKHPATHVQQIREQTWLLKTAADTFMITQYGGIFRSKVDPNVKLFVPPNAVIQPTEITLQIAKVDQEIFYEAKRQNHDKLLANLTSVGDIVHANQSSSTDILKPVTMAIPAPPVNKGGKLHIMSYNDNNMCSVSSTPYRQQKGYITFQTWRLAGGKGAVLTKAKCKYKASRSVETLLSHLQH